MKKIFFLLCIVSGQFLAAQNYQNICSPGTTFFKAPDNTFMAFRRDSVIPFANSDTVFMSYRAIRDTAVSHDNCADTTNGSLLGLTIRKKRNSWFYFFNKTGDTVKINSQAALNDSWKFCNLTGKSYLSASIIAIGADSVLGLIDQVKTITFQAKDSLNNNISHPLNQQSIKLSQNYGLSKMLDVYTIPNDTTMYILGGKSNPAMGIQNLTWQEIYNFNVGDVFHYIRSYMDGGSKSIYKVLSRTNYGNDSVVFTMQHCSRMEFAEAPYYSTAYDTVAVSYNLINQNNTWLSRLPGEFVTPGHIADSYSYSLFANSRRIKSMSAKYIYTNSLAGSDTCWRTFAANFFVDEQSFAEGLGQTHTYYYDFNEGQPQHMQEDLVYYKKGNETWGTPVATDCATLTDVPEIEGKKEIILSIIPDPVEFQAEILIRNVNETTDFKLILSDFLGRTILQKEIASNPYTLIRQGPAGLYFISVYDKNGNLVARNKVVYK